MLLVKEQARLGTVLFNYYIQRIQGNKVTQLANTIVLTEDTLYGPGHSVVELINVVYEC